MEGELYEYPNQLNQSKKVIAIDLICTISPDDEREHRIKEKQAMLERTTMFFGVKTLQLAFFLINKNII